jgi:hypothetical protein
MLDDAAPEGLVPPQPSGAVRALEAIAGSVMSTGEAAPRHDPARTFFTLMLLLALALGALVVASQLRQGGSSVRCEITGPPGCNLHVDGRETGLRTRVDPLLIRLPPGRHKVGLRGHGAPPGDRAIDVTTADVCRMSFDDGR